MDTSEIRSKYNIDSIGAKKAEYETLIATTPTSNNFAQYSYFSNLHQLISTLFSYIERYDQALEMLKTESDPTLLEMAKEEQKNVETLICDTDNQIETLEIEHKFSDPDDNKSVVLEIRAGAGGDEAGLFAADLFRMYSKYAETNGWQIVIVDSNANESGGYKEVIANIVGENIYKKLKYESGVHRVQRIPSTESSGRIHTSTASVAILPLVKDIDIQIDPAELRIDVMRASGAGGQCVNRTDSAVRITHIPTGIVVSCQETKHQSQNKEKAMELLRSRLYDRKKKEEDAKRENMRSSQIGSMMRAEKIRTYNFPQNRVTDHRIKKSWFNIEAIMNGSLDEIVNDIDQEILKIKLLEENK